MGQIKDDKILNLIENSNEYDIENTKEMSSIVCVGDIVSLNLIYPKDDKVELTVLLVSGNPDIHRPDIKETSTNSPIGSSIRGQKIGDVVSCKTPDSIMQIEILSIIKAPLKEKKDKILTKKKDK
jgi:transcription elongation GreA/GreB family factor